MQSQGGNENWTPLESNPEAINPFIQKMGLNIGAYSAQDLLSTEEWALEMIRNPVLGVLFLYQVTPEQTQFTHEEAASLKPEEVPQDIFFMKQYALNACGTIGLFHIIINAVDRYPNVLVAGESYLSNFKANSANLPADKIGELFKQSEGILQEHRQAAAEGQSAAQSECDSHFISFISHSNILFELDGFKKCPVNHGPCEPQQLLARATEVIKGFMQRDPENAKFSMIVLAANPE